MDGYISLFIAAFLAATIVPAASELLFAVLLILGYEPWALWAWASAGNTLGAAVNWALGRWAQHYRDRSWFPFKRGSFEHAHDWFAKYGVWCLLFAWLPLLGDAFTFVAGLLRIRLDVFLVLTFVGKATRYAMLLGLLLVAMRSWGLSP